MYHLSSDGVEEFHSCRSKIISDVSLVYYHTHRSAMGESRRGTNIVFEEHSVLLQNEVGQMIKSKLVLGLLQTLAYLLN